jgi:hypothetical protein
VEIGAETALASALSTEGARGQAKEYGAAMSHCVHPRAAAIVNAIRRFQIPQI